MTDKRKYTSIELYRRLLLEARPYWPHIGVLFFLSLLAPPIALLVPLPVRVVVDNVIGSHPLPVFLEGAASIGATGSSGTILVLAVVLLIGVAVLDQLQRLANTLLSTYTGEQLTLAYRAELFRHVQRLSLTYHDLKGTTDSTYRIQYDAPCIQWVVIDGIIPFVSALLTLGGMIYVTALIDMQLALVALAIVPILYLVSRLFTARLRGHWLVAYERQSSAISVVQEVLAAARVVKAFGQEEREHQRFVHRSREGIGARIRVAFAEGGFGLVVGLTMAGGMAVVLIIGARHVLAGSLTVGQLLIVMAYLSQLYDRLEKLTRKIADLQGSMASAERTFSLLDELPNLAEKPNARPISRASGNIEFRNVSFGYETDRAVLKNVSFEVKSGMRVGIAGPTGAGKTTLVSLLTRFYDPTEGQILLDGVDLRDYKLVQLRDQFSLVLQEPVLFSVSLAENIAYARPGVGENEIMEATKLANAHEFISRLPEGYQTLVGERGMTLSGGERQRISLARAFLKDAPILILDEPTSAVDLKTESAILESIERLVRSRTTFLISHRLSLLRACDVILKVEGGGVVVETLKSSPGLSDELEDSRVLAQQKKATA